MIIYKIAGVDEAGRGPLAGPVVAAAVIIETNIQGIRDSKKISEKKRLHLFKDIYDNASSIGIGLCSSSEIDKLNIHYASLLAMKRAVDNLTETPKQILVDGNFTPPDIPYPCFAIVKGDVTN